MAEIRYQQVCDFFIQIFWRIYSEMVAASIECFVLTLPIFQQKFHGNQINLHIQDKNDEFAPKKNGNLIYKFNTKNRTCILFLNTHFAAFVQKFAAMFQSCV